MHHEAVHIRALNPVIGAEIHGVDLSVPLGDKAFAQIRQALLDHKVIFFRDQELDPEAQVRLAQQWGEMEPPHPFFPKIEEFPNVAVLENDAERPPEVNVWHTDVTWRDKPPMGSVLYAVDVPDCGGDTLWADMEAVYEDLSPALKEMLEGLRAVHDIGIFSNAGNYDNAQDAEQMNAIRKAYPPQSHPIVRVHPETGRKSLFVNATFTTHIEGMNLDEGRALLELLYKKVLVPEVQVRFPWTKGAVAIWDNRCTQHYAAADYYPNHRRMHRVTLVGDRPVGVE